MATSEHENQHQAPSDVVKALQSVDDWSFDVFALADADGDKPLQHLVSHLYHSYGFIKDFKIDISVLNNFLARIESGYRRYGAPYHNNLHAVDVTQTFHFMISKTGLRCIMTNLEVFAALLAASAHDYEHTGQSNNFLIMTGSDRAIIYNDRSVQENHHVCALFFVLKEHDCNILSSLTRDQFRQLRAQVIDMILSTDMAYHFQNLKDIKKGIATNTLKVDISKALALLLHACDISASAKEWRLHLRWVDLLLEELFKQGDQERALGLPISPLCDRHNILISESQIHFIDFIVEPTFSLCADMLECLLESIVKACYIFKSTIGRGTVATNGSESGNKFSIQKPWIQHLIENKNNWRKESYKDWVRWVDMEEQFLSCHTQVLVDQL